MNLTEKFWALVQIKSPDECWPWLGNKMNDGRGRFWIKRKAFLAPRLALEFTGRPVPKDKRACHACDNPNCCNPNHLWIGTDKENSRDASAKKRCNGQKKTHCINGHPFSGDNLGVTSRGTRKCKACNRVYQERYEAKRRAALKDTP